MDIFTNIKEKIKGLPDSPGVYQFLNEKNDIIYIGKAKNLKKRVSSYFNNTKSTQYKVKLMVNKIRGIDYIIVENESDALLLENNLIKKHKPRYNVQLKDDKTFPWICIKKESFPRVFSTRKVIKDGSEYFGPFTSSIMVRTLLDLIKQIYPLRTCKLNLSEENIKEKKFKVCLEYHIGNCMGPCEGKESAEEYMIKIDQIRNILKGNIQEALVYMDKIMRKYANELKFEDAERVKEKINIIEKFRSKSTIVNPKLNNIDVFSFRRKEGIIAVNFLKVSNGAVIKSHTLELLDKLNEPEDELLAFAITDIRFRMRSNAKDMILPFNIGDVFPEINKVVPIRGDKRKLLNLSQRNADFFINERIRQKQIFVRKKNKTKVLDNIRKDLHLSQTPEHIECFDNSNIQGDYPVAACVVFRKGLPSKGEYRHYNIKTVSGPDDYASMEEIVYRRYYRLIKEGRELPQLIIVDGGKGQLNAALKSIKKLNISGNISIIGIAKRLEEIYFPGDPIPLYLDKRSESLKLIQQLRNEAHRFGIDFHRKKSEKSMLKSGLDALPGIGEKTKQLLINRFSDINGIRLASKDELVVCVGRKKAEIIFDNFHSFD